MTVHEQMATTVLESIVGAPEFARVLGQTAQRLRSGYFDDSHVAPIGQTMRGAATWKAAQVAAFLAINAALNSGEYARFEVPVQGTPCRDAERGANAATLATVQQPFAADLDMTQNGADQDGTFSWTRPIRGVKSLGIPTINGCDRSPVLIPCKINPATAPLEVGTTLPSRTLMHLRVEGLVARWPYGHDAVTVIVDRKLNWPAEQGQRNWHTDAQSITCRTC